MWLTSLQASSSNTSVLSKVSLGALNVLFRINRSYVRIQIGRKNSERRSFQKLKSFPSMKGVRLGRTSELFLAESVRLPLFDDQRNDDMRKNNYFGVCYSLVYLCAITFGSRKDVHTIIIISGNLKLALQLIACLNSGQSKKLVLVKGCGKCFYIEAACFFCPVLREKRRTPEVKHCRKREMCNSYAVALLVKVSVE